MSNNKSELNEKKLKTLHYAFFGASFGAILGLIAYVNNWLG